MLKDKVIQFFAEANCPLKQKMIDDLIDGIDYAVFTAKCRVCGHTSVDIAPTENDLDNLECENCGNMSVEPVMPDEELEDYQLDNFNQNRLFVS
jgi:hypothetical protein